MELRHIHAFIAVAEELHFGRAAERLRLAQPPLSQQIRQLEKELGVQLFNRTTRSVQLTDSGEAFLTHARLVFRELNEAELAAKAAGSGQYGRVRIGFAGASSRFLLPQLAQGVQQKFPNIELVLQGQLYANAAQEALIKGDIEVGFVRLPFTVPGLNYRPIEEETLMCVVPADHWLTQQASISVADLAQEPFVSFPRGSGSTMRAITHRVCWEHGFVPNVVQDAPDSYTIQALVAAGQGISLTLSSTIHIQQPGVKYLKLEGNVPRFQSALAWRADNTSAAVESVIQVAEAILPKPKQPLGTIENSSLDSEE